MASEVASSSSSMMVEVAESIPTEAASERADHLPRDEPVPGPSGVLGLVLQSPSLTIDNPIPSTSGINSEIRNNDTNSNQMNPLQQMNAMVMISPSFLESTGDIIIKEEPEFLTEDPELSEIHDEHINEENRNHEDNDDEEQLPADYTFDNNSKEPDGVSQDRQCSALTSESVDEPLDGERLQKLIEYYKKEYNLKELYIRLQNCDKIWETLQLIKQAQNDMFDSDGEEIAPEDEDNEDNGQIFNSTGLTDETSFKEPLAASNISNQIDQPIILNRVPKEPYKRNQLPEYRYINQGRRKFYHCFTCKEKFTTYEMIKEHAKVVHGVFYKPKRVYNLTKPRSRFSGSFDSSIEPKSEPLEAQNDYSQSMEVSMDNESMISESSQSNLSSSLYSNGVEDARLRSQQSTPQPLEIRPQSSPQQKARKTFAAERSRVEKNKVKCILCKRITTNIFGHLKDYHKVGCIGPIAAQCEILGTVFGRGNSVEEPGEEVPEAVPEPTESEAEQITVKVELPLEGLSESNEQNPNDTNVSENEKSSSKYPVEYAEEAMSLDSAIENACRKVNSNYQNEQNFELHSMRRRKRKSGPFWTSALIRKNKRMKMEYLRSVKNQGVNRNMANVQSSINDTDNKNVPTFDSSGHSSTVYNGISVDSVERSFGTISRATHPYKCNICLGFYKTYKSYNYHQNLHRKRGDTVENFDFSKCRFLNSPITKGKWAPEFEPNVKTKLTEITTRQNDNTLELNENNVDQPTVCDCGRSFRTYHTMYLHKVKCQGNIDSSINNQSSSPNTTNDADSGISGISIKIKKNKNDSYEVVNKGADEPCENGDGSEDKDNHSILRIQVADNDEDVNIEEDDLDSRSSSSNNRSSSRGSIRLRKQIISMAKKPGPKSLTTPNEKNLPKTAASDTERENEVLSPYKCPTCHLRFSNTSLLMEHAAQEKHECKYTCPCGKLFRFLKYLNLHIRRYHPLLLKCGYCKTNFDKVESFNSHKCKVIEGDSFLEPIIQTSCIYCNDSVDIGDAFDQHMTQVHLKSQETMFYHCFKCERRFDNPIQRKSHFNKEHGYYLCRVCDKRLHLDNLARHEAYHDGLGFPCHSCKKAFSHKDMLTRHVNQTHSQKAQEVIECRICLKLIKVKSFKKHMSVHVHTEICGKCSNICADDQPKGFGEDGVNDESLAELTEIICANCNKKFLLKKEYENHILENCCMTGSQ